MPRFFSVFHMQLANYEISRRNEKKSNEDSYTFLNLPGIFHFFFTLPLEIPYKKLNRWIFHKLCQIPWQFQGQKQRPLEIPQYFFLVTPGNSISSILPVWIFSGIASPICKNSPKFTDFGCLTAKVNLQRQLVKKCENKVFWGFLPCGSSPRSLEADTPQHKSFGCAGLQM